MHAELSANEPPAPGATEKAQGLSLRRNVSWTTAGNLLYALCQWGVLTIIAKSGTPAMVGIFALGLAITAPIIQFANLQLRGIQATDARHEYAFADYFTLRLITTTLAVVVCVGIAGGGNQPQETTAVIALISLAKAADAISDVFYGHFQQRERMDVIALAQVANGILSLVFVAIGLILTDRIVVAASGFLLGSVVPLAAYTIPAAMRSLGPDFRLRGLKRSRMSVLRRLAWAALPLGAVMLLISLNTNIPRYVIGYVLGERELGIFAALAYVIVAGGMVITAVGQAASPRLARQFAAGDADGFVSLLRRMIVISLAIGAVGAVLASVIGERLVSLIYTSEYADDEVTLVVLASAAGLLFAASFAGFGMTAARRFGAQVPVFLAVVLTSAIASLVLIPAGGVRGAAVALAAGAVVQLTGSLMVVRRALADSGVTQ
jgi:O-antigen/teichoic acid export membrane protein